MYSRPFFVAMLLVASLAPGADVRAAAAGCAVTGRAARRQVVTLALLLTRLYGPLTALSNVRVDVMSALVSLRARLRGARPARPWSTTRPTRPTDRRARPGSSSDDVRFRYPSAAEVSLASLEDVAALDRTPRAAGAARASRSPCSRGRWSRWSARPGAGKTTTSHARAPRLRRHWGAVLRRRASTCARPRWTRCADAIGVVTQDAHLFHETIADEPALRRPQATDDELWTALTRRADRRAGPRRLPDGLDTVVGERGYRLSGGEKQRLAIARLLLKAPAIVDPGRGHRAPRLRVGGGSCSARCRRALPGARALVIAHRLSTDPRRRPDPGGRRRPGRQQRPARRAAGRRRRSTAELFRTQFAARAAGTAAVPEFSARPPVIAGL